MVTGMVMASDEDVLDILTFTLLNGTDMFSIQSSQLMTLTPLDYEKTASYVLAVKVTDSGSPPASVKKKFFFFCLYNF
jgi:hypothetical protein